MTTRTGSQRRPAARSTSSKGTVTTIVAVTPAALSATAVEAPKPTKATHGAAKPAPATRAKAPAKPASQSSKSQAKPTSKSAKASKSPAKPAAKSPSTKKQKRPAKRKVGDPPVGVDLGTAGEDGLPQIPAMRVRRMHRRDINRVWEFLKRVFRDVNQRTVEYQRPRSKQRFEESYNDEGIAQLLFEVHGDIVGYAECAFEVTGSDNWINPRYFESRDMRPLYVQELAVHPDFQGQGVGSFMLEQLDHLARLRGCTHLVLEVAENNTDALTFYRKRAFTKLDATLFLAHRIEREPELLPPRILRKRE